MEFNSNQWPMAGGRIHQIRAWLPHCNKWTWLKTTSITSESIQRWNQMVFWMRYRNLRWFQPPFPAYFLMQWAEKFQSGRLMKWTFVETIGHSIEINFHWHRLAFACRYAADFHSINGQIQSDDINSSCCCCCCCCWSYSDGNDSIILIRDCNSIEWESFHLSGSVHWQKWQFIYRCVRIR